MPRGSPSWPSVDEISDLYGKAEPETALLLDTGHAVAGGFDYTRLIERFGDRIVHIHLKGVRGRVLQNVRACDLSFNVGVRSGMFTVPGDGVVHFDPIARFVRENGYRGWLVVEAEQDPALAPSRLAVARAFDHIRGVFTG